MILFLFDTPSIIPVTQPATETTADQVLSLTPHAISEPANIRRSTRVRKLPPILKIFTVIPY